MIAANLTCYIIKSPLHNSALTQSAPPRGSVLDMTTVNINPGDEWINKDILENNASESRVLLDHGGELA